MGRVGAKGSIVAGMARLLALAMLWQPGAAAQDRVCWLRDGSSPAPSLVYLLCEQGWLWVTTDGGATWSSRDTGAAGHLRNIDFLDANHGFAVGDDGQMLVTANAGKTWEARKTGVKQHLAAIQFVGQSGWAAGFDGVILHSADGGNTWAPQETGTKESLESLFFLDADHGWAVGWAGTILLTTDGGRTWRQVRSDAASWSLCSVYFRDARNGWIVGFGGRILRSRDGGVTWEAQASPVKAWLTSVLFDGSNRGWIAADDGFLVSEDGGESWRQVPVEDRLFLSQLIPVNGSLWGIGQLGVLQLRGGLTWKRITTLVTDDPTRDMPTTKIVSMASHPN